MTVKILTTSYLEAEYVEQIRPGRAGG